MRNSGNKFTLGGISLVNIIGGIIIVYLVVVLAQTIRRNYTLGKQIDDLRSQMVMAQLQKDQLAYSIEYYKTDSFREREARSKLGLQLPGEHVVIISGKSGAPKPLQTTNQKPADNRSNFAQWMDFLGGRD